MATGDINDCYGRLVQATPVGWFNGPIVSALLYGAASALAACYALLGYARQQTRIATATDGWLDLISGDFFGLTLPRNSNESDASFRARIQAQMFRQRVTRPAMVAMLESLTGNTPVIIEPRSPGDCGGYGVPVMGYGLAGRYGSLGSPYQAWIEVYRPKSIGVPNVPGYGCPQGGYGVACEWAPAGNLFNVTDLNIFAAVEAVRPAATRIWVRLNNA